MVLKHKTQLTFLKLIAFVLSCGGPTRTNDLQVMSLASYQLLHSAILKLSISQLRVQRYTVFCECANFRWKKLMFGVNIFSFHYKLLVNDMFFTLFILLWKG